MKEAQQSLKTLAPNLNFTHSTSYSQYKEAQLLKCKEAYRHKHTLYSSLLCFPSLHYTHLQNPHKNLRRPIGVNSLYDPIVHRLSLHQPTHRGPLKNVRAYQPQVIWYAPLVHPKVFIIRRVRSYNNVTNLTNVPSPSVSALSLLRCTHKIRQATLEPKNDLFIGYKQECKHKIFYFDLLQTFLQTQNFLVKFFKGYILKLQTTF